jgi:hypothetical protein
MACLPKPFTSDQLRKVATAAVADRAPAAAATFSREQREAAAQAIFGRLRVALATIPQWAAEMGASQPAPFFAKKLLTGERIDALLDALLPIYREVVTAQAAQTPSGPGFEAAAMRGELRSWPIGELLNFFAASGKVGELRISRGGRALITYWRRGEIVLVTTDDADEYVRGVTLGRLPVEALARAKAEQQASGRPVFVTLAEEGAPLPAPLGDLLHRQGRRLLLDAIDATAATFTWRDLPALPLYVEAHGRHVSTARNTLVFNATSADSPPPPATTLEQLALERMRRDSPAMRVSDDAVFDRVRGFTDRIRRFDLAADERRVLAATDGAHTVGEIAARVGIDAQEVRAVFARLSEVGLVAPRAVADGDAPRPVLILEPDVDGFQKPLEHLLRSHAVDTPVLSLAEEHDILAAIQREHPRLVILNATANGAMEATARAVRAKGTLADVSLVAVLEPDHGCDIKALQAAGFDAVFVKPVPYADLERLIA